MKEAMWGVGFIMLAIFGIFLISLFGNITVTNQQDYTALKNAVEASMNDAKYDVGFVSGFCICIDKTKEKENGKYVFRNSNEYTIIKDNIVDGICPVVIDKKCEYISGQYAIDKKVFAESFVRRFSESVKGNTEYKIVIQDIIEYPPKVSVEIYSTNGNELDNGEYTIVNRIDAILEVDSEISPPIEIKSGDCEPKDIKCNELTGVCQDSKGNICGEVTKCKGELTCKNEGNSVICKDKNGNICSKITYTIPEIPVNEKETVKKEIGEKIKEITHTGGCFLAGTKVKVKDGYQNIEKINIGDYVLTYNVDKKINEYKVVNNVFIIDNTNEELYKIKTNDTEMILTSNHHVYIEKDNDYEYLPANKLSVGNMLRYSNGELHKIIEISHSPLTETVYNIETADNHNYYVGEKEILVHNASAVIDCGTAGQANGRLC